MFKIKYPDLPEPQNDSLANLNCNSCNAGFYKNQSTPFAASCGHYFCKQRCYQRLIDMKVCPVCGPLSQKRPLIFKKIQVSAIRYNPNGGNLFNLGVNYSRSYKRYNLNEKTKLIDFLYYFAPVKSYLESLGVNVNKLILAIGSKTKLYGQVFDKSLDQLAPIYNLTAANVQNKTLNVINFNQRFLGGTIQNQQYNNQISHIQLIIKVKKQQ